MTDNVISERVGGRGVSKKLQVMGAKTRKDRK
jgi:hypothetical protein